jgi:hypothetical protein
MAGKQKVDARRPDFTLLQLRADLFGERHSGQRGLALRLFVSRSSGFRFALGRFVFLSLAFDMAIHALFVFGTEPELLLRSFR